MKRLFLIVIVFITAIACTSDEQKKTSGSSPSGGTGSRGDTASYERMPQQTNDSIKK